jgi:hypothetical protein
MTQSVHASPPTASVAPGRWALSAAFIIGTIGLGLVATSPAVASPSDDRVLILETTVAGGLSSREAQAATNLGFEVDLVDEETWAGMTQEQFDGYRAIILGDPACGYPDAILATPAANASVWGPVVDGNVMIAGNDPEAHGKGEVSDNGVALATSEAGKTGAYISLSCYYHGVSSGTAIPVLDHLSSFGSFTATGEFDCFDSVHVVADHPALTGLTDEYLSSWGCSVHEAFSSWPADFVVLAIATTGGAYTASDGTVGTPYIVARGDTIKVISNISLDGPSSLHVETVATYEATLDDGESPISGATVTFTSLSGPHAGVLGTATSDGSGIATLEFTGATEGTDLVVASYVDGVTQTSGQVATTWTAAPEPSPTPTPEPSPTPTPEPSPTPTPDLSPTPTPEPTESPAAGPSVGLGATFTVAPTSTVAGDPTPFEAMGEHCVDACTFDWFVNDAFQTSTEDAYENVDPTALVATAESAADFTAYSNVELTLAAGTHAVRVEVTSGDDSTQTLVMSVVVAGAAMTPPPTSTEIVTGSGGTHWSVQLGLALMVLAGLLAGLGLLSLRQARPLDR